MSRLFDTSGADALYDRWQEPGGYHEEDGCDRCHRIHVERREYSAGAALGCEACAEFIADQIFLGEWCRRHGPADIDYNAGGAPFCHACRNDVRRMERREWIFNAIVGVVFAAFCVALSLWKGFGR